MMFRVSKNMCNLDVWSTFCYRLQSCQLVPGFTSHLKTQLNIGFQIMIGHCGSKPVIVFVPGISMWWYKYTAAHIFIYVVMGNNNICAKLQGHFACYIVGYETIVYKLYDAYLTITVALNMYIAALSQRKRLRNNLGDWIIISA